MMAWTTSVMDPAYLSASVLHDMQMNSTLMEDQQVPVQSGFTFSTIRCEALKLASLLKWGC